VLPSTTGPRARTLDARRAISAPMLSNGSSPEVQVCHAVDRRPAASHTVEFARHLKVVQAFTRSRLRSGLVRPRSWCHGLEHIPLAISHLHVKVGRHEQRLGHSNAPALGGRGELHVREFVVLVSGGSSSK
jgi:hypothetical protein